MTLRIDDTFFAPPPVGKRKSYITNLPVLVSLPREIITHKSVKYNITKVPFSLIERLRLPEDILEKLNPFICHCHVQTVVETHTTVLDRNAKSWHPTNL